MRKVWKPPRKVRTESLESVIAGSDRFSNIVVSWKHWHFWMISVAAVCRAISGRVTEDGENIMSLSK